MERPLELDVEVDDTTYTQEEEVGRGVSDGDRMYPNQTVDDVRAEKYDPLK